MSLTSVNLPTNLKYIGPAVFYKCPLTEINLPNKLQTIGSQAFFDTKIVNVTIPASVKTIDIFSFPSTLSKVYFEKTTGWKRSQEYSPNDLYVDLKYNVDISSTLNNPIEAAKLLKYRKLDTNRYVYSGYAFKNVG